MMPTPGASSRSSMPRSFPFNLKFTSTARNRVYKNLQNNRTKLGCENMLNIRLRSHGLPSFRQIATWMRTSWTFDCQLALSGSIYTCRILPVACALQHQKVLPDARHAVKFRILVLQQADLARHYFKVKKTHNCLMKLEVVSHMKDCVVEII